MYYFLKLKKIIIKLLTCLIFPEKYRKNARNFLYYFSFKDLISFKRQNFYIVSLGNNCLPRVLTTVLKLKPRKIYGEKTCPFDLSFHLDIEKIAEIIHNDFENFFDDLVFDKVWQNRYLKSTYPHDNKLNKEQFIKRYKKRINNFKYILKSDKMIYFIYSNFDNNICKRDVLLLYDAILKHRDKPFKLIILTSCKQFLNFENSNIILLEEDFSIKHSNWVKSFVNDYGNINNEYTRFCQKTSISLNKIVK